MVDDGVLKLPEGPGCGVLRKQDKARLKAAG